MDLVSVQLSDGFAILDQSTKDIITTLLETRGIAEDVQDQMLTVAQLLNRVERMVTRTEMLNVLNQTGRSQGSAQGLAIDDGDGLQRQLEELANDKHLRALADERILVSPLYPTMTDRLEEVENAHAKTFQWIFRDRDSTSDEVPWDNFAKWLSRGTGVYWIKGKAGSGKSTLMRYIHANPQTKQ
jgi:hypothetical protein